MESSGVLCQYIVDSPVESSGVQFCIEHGLQSSGVQSCVECDRQQWSPVLS